MSAPNFQISAGKDGKTANKVADVDDIAKPLLISLALEVGCSTSKAREKRLALGTRCFKFPFD